MEGTLLHLPYNIEQPACRAFLSNCVCIPVAKGRNSLHGVKDRVLGHLMYSRLLPCHSVQLHQALQRLKPCKLSALALRKPLCADDMDEHKFTQLWHITALAQSFCGVEPMINSGDVYQTALHGRL